MENQFFFFFQVFIPLSFMFIWTWKRSKTKYISAPNLPPGPWRLPIIGNLHQMVGSLPHHRLRDLAKKYGPLMYLQLGQVSNVIISSPEAAKEVMKTHDVTFANRPFVLAAHVLAYNSRDIAFGAYDNYWRQLKKICTLELLTAKRVQSFRSIMEEEVSYLNKSIYSNSGLLVNVSRISMSLANCIILRTALGKVLKQEDALTPVILEVIHALGGFSIADFFPSIKLLHILSGMRAKLQKLHQEVDMILETIIAEHKVSRRTENFGSKTEANDLVHVLLNLQDNGTLDFPLTTQDIKAVMLDMLLGGTETASTTIEWAMSEMMKNPKVMEKAQEEVRQVFTAKEKIDVTDLHLLKYLDLVIKETLRLHPPAPLIAPREARERVEMIGCEIPAKTQVIINAWAIGRDPHCWKEPERFYPERFIDNPIDYKGTNFKFIPFGAGRRMCPGVLYGITSISLALANLLFHFDWKLPEGLKPENLDMSEAFGITVRRKYDLYLIPIPHNIPVSSNNF